jgi:uncharacterized protein YunC (DUF1805 family)
MQQVAVVGRRSRGLGASVDDYVPVEAADRIVRTVIDGDRTISLARDRWRSLHQSPRATQADRHAAAQALSDLNDAWLKVNRLKFYAFFIPGVRSRLKPLVKPPLYEVLTDAERAFVAMAGVDVAALKRSGDLGTPVAPVIVIAVSAAVGLVAVAGAAVGIATSLNDRARARILELALEAEKAGQVPPGTAAKIAAEHTKQDESKSKTGFDVAAAIVKALPWAIGGAVVLVVAPPVIEAVRSRRR